MFDPGAKGLVILELVLSTSGMKIPNRLHREAVARNIPHDVWLIQNQPRFIGRTGLAGTPRTILLDSQSRVRLSISRMTATNVSLLANFVADVKSGHGVIQIGHEMVRKQQPR